MNREYTDTGIRINRGQRNWRRYGSKILGICIAAAAIIAIIAIAASIGRGGKPSANNASGGNASGNQNGSSGAVTTASADGNTTASEDAEKESTTATETTSGGNGKGGAISGKPEQEEFTSEAFYEDAAFIGDLFVYGIDEYEYIPSSNLFSATFMTAAKAMDLTEDVSAIKPSKIFVMLGFDDDNLAEDRSPEASADSIISLLQELKDSNPSAKIYAVSEIPISKEYDSGGGDYVTQKDLDEINNLVKKGAEAAGIGYIDVADCLKDGDYLSEDYTTDGCHVMKQYYPFVLNGIAEAAK